jgi:hypothetical protein
VKEYPLGVTIVAFGANTGYVGRIFDLNPNTKQSTFFPTLKRVQWIAHQNEPRAGKSRANLSTEHGTTAFLLSRQMLIGNGKLKENNAALPTYT